MKGTAYVVAVAAIAGAALTRWAVDPWLGDHLPLPVFFAAVAVATWYGGVRPALLAVAMGYLVAEWMFIDPRGAFGLEAPRDALGLFFYLMTCAIIIGFGQGMRRARRRAEAGRDDARLKLAAIVESSQDAIIGKDLNGIITSWNRGAERLYGYTAEEVVGKSLSMLIPDERSTELPDIMERLKRGERVEHFETRRIRKDGQCIDVAVGISPVKDAGGTIIGASAIARDITEHKRADAALRESEQRLAYALEAAAEGVWDWNIQSGQIRYSRQWIESLGYSVDEVPPHISFWESIVHPDDVARVQQALQAHVAGHAAVYISENRLRTKSGEYRWHLDRGKVVEWDSSGNPRRMIGSEVDITDRKRAEMALRHQAEEVERLMDVLPVAVWIAHDPQCTQITGNRAGHALLRVPTGKNLSKTAPSDERPGFRIFTGGREVMPDELPMQYAAAHGVEVRDVDEEIVFDDGSVVRAFGSATPLFDEMGKVRGCIAAFMDVTEWRRLDKELQQKIEELAAADLRKDKFLATLAHELRNPLAPLRHSLEIMKRADGDVGVIEQARQTMERQLAQMVRLVDELLDISRINTDKLELRKQRVELAEVIAQAVEAVRPLADSSQHQLSIALPAGPVWLDADPVRLAQVFANLLNNACKFTDAGGEIRLEGQTRDGDVLVRVQDSGIGIAPELLPRIFDLFIQGNRPAERAHEGLGIGLTLVKRLVEMHGGAIEAHSDGPGRGSEFVVRLPVVKDESGESKDEGERMKDEGVADASLVSSSSPGKRRILAVDDNRDSTRSLAVLLRQMGNEVLTAHDGLEAVEVAAAFCPDVVLLDIGMPKMDGLEAARRIRQLPCGKAMTLVAVTGWGQDSDKCRSKDAGFDHHVVKPIDLDALEKLLSNGRT